MSKSILEHLSEKIENDEEGKATLSVNEIIELQNRVKHYLNSYETENKLNASDVAKKLGYTAMHYSRFKLVGTFNKIASCLMFLSNIADLKKMSLTEFIINIENKPLKTPDAKLSRGMWDWEIDSLGFLSKLDPTLRRILTRKIIKESENNEKAFLKIEFGISILILITQLSAEDLKLIISVVKNLSNRKFSNQNQEIDNIELNELQDLKRDFIRFIKNKFTYNKD